MTSSKANQPVALPETATDWQPFPGGELEGQPSTARCAACRDARRRDGDAALRAGTLCFQCYRAELDRQRALRAAAALPAASEERFQLQLPLEPVDRPRVAMLRAARLASRSAAGPSPRARGFVERRRRAQIDARHTLDRLAAGLRARGIGVANAAPERAELRPAVGFEFPAAWLPFLTARRDGTTPAHQDRPLHDRHDR